MTLELLAILGIGFLFGIRHAFDPDHVIAVSTIASRTGNLFKAATSGIYWGMGHSLTLFVVGMIVIGFKLTIPEPLEMFMEMLVGVMLIVLGWTTFRSFKQRNVHTHVHTHEEDGETHTHFHSHTGDKDDHNHKHAMSLGKKSFLIGMVHGLAGSGALVVLTMSTLQTISEAAVYILLFGGGNILGMLIFATLLGLPFVLMSKYSFRTERVLGMSTGLFSMAFGVFFIYEMAMALS